MKSVIFVIPLFLLIFWGCDQQHPPAYQAEGPQSQIIVDMIQAVNDKNAIAYVAHFADSVQVFVESELKVKGRRALQANRAHHFEAHPEVRSEIQYLLEIDNKVILHDKVWLTKEDQQGRDIVEIFTFNDEKVTRVDVVQPKDLFRR